MWLNSLTDGTLNMRVICATSIMVNALFCDVAGGESRDIVVKRLLTQVKTDFNVDEALHPKLRAMIAEVTLQDVKTEPETAA